MLAVVTGASGFIGTNLVAALREAGVAVRTLARPERPGGDAVPGVERHVVDLRGDVDMIARHPIWDGVTHVFHLAGATRARNDAAFAAANTVPTARLADALTRVAAPPRLVYVSSQAAAGPARAADRPVTEDDPPEPIEPYGLSKLAAEDAVRGRASQLPVVILRPAAVYGPHDRDFLAVFRQVRFPIAFLATPREHQFSVVHSGDLTRAMLAVARDDRAVGQTCFVASSEPVTWQRFYDAAARALGRTPRTVALPSAVVGAAAAVGDLWGALTDTAPLVSRHKVALGCPPFWLCSAHRIQQLIGWKATIPLDDGMRQTADWYRAHGWA